MVQILIDSASDIDLEEAKDLGVNLISMEIMFNQDVFLDGVNLSKEQFYTKLEESEALPKTSQINEYRFSEKFKELTKNGDDVIVITMSSKLSGTYNNAIAAAEKYNGKVRVIDSLSVSIGERVLLYRAIDLVKKGLPIDAIVNDLNAKKHQIKLLAIVDTLKYLKKGGRLKSATAFVGEMLNIKPALSVESGEIQLIGKAIGTKMSLYLFDKQIEKNGPVDYDLPYAFAYSGRDNTLLKKYLNHYNFNKQNENSGNPIFLIGSTIGTHVGPGTSAVAFFAKENNAWYM